MQNVKSHLFILTRTLLLIGLVFSSTLSILATEYSFRHYGREEGLSHLSVTCLYQDRRGFMWIGTRVGLNCFDGSSITCMYPNSNDRNSIRSATINVVTESNDSLLWIGTSNGCSVFDYQTGSYQPLPSVTPEISGNVTDIVPDGDGNMWIIDSFGLHKIAKGSDKSQFFKTSNTFVPAKVLCTNTGRVWVASCLGDLLAYNPVNGSMTPHPILTEEEQRSMVVLNNLTETKDGSLFITTQNNGARLFDPTTNKVTKLFTTTNDGKPIFIHTLLREHDNEIALGTENGIYIHKVGTGFTRHIVSDSHHESSLSSNAVHALYRDREGGIWIGTYFGGINYLPCNAQDFRVILPKTADGSCCAKVIREIIPDKEGHLWVGTEDGGLCL